MEKLSKLLNEYLESQNKDIQQFMNIAALMTQSDSKLYQTYIISKNFGFVKWLVEQDKIDTFRLLEKWFDTQKGYEWVHYHTVSEGNTDLLLMLLSISENPIELLISLLK